MSEPRRFDFATNSWVRDDFLAHRVEELPVPAMPPEPGRWTAVPAAPPLLERALPGLAATLIALALVAAYAVGGKALLFAIGLFFVCALVIRHNVSPSFARLRVEPEDRRFMEQPDDLEVCLVEIEIVFDDHPVGNDRGVAWFADGTLFYNGRRTSFAVGGQDVLPKSYWGEYGRERAGALPADAVPLRTSRPRTYVRFRPLEGPGRNETEQARRFVLAREAFRERPTLSEALRQWPPFKT